MALLLIHTCLHRPFKFLLGFSLFRGLGSDSTSGGRLEEEDEEEEELVDTVYEDVDV